MPETIQAYIEAVENQIRWKRARPVVSLELRRHLEDQRDDFAAEGREDAERLAVEEMGDPVAVGMKLDRLHRPRPQWGLLGLTIALACAGAFLRVRLTWGNRRDAVSPAMTALALVLGTAALLGVYFLDFTSLARHARGIYAGALTAGVLAMWLTPEINHASYYTRYVILFYPVVYALWLYSCRGSGWRRFALAVAGGIPLAVVSILAPSLSGLLLLLLCGFVLLLCAIRMEWFGPKRWRLTGAALALAVGMPVLFFERGYGQPLVDRLHLAFHPELDPLGAGFQGWVVKGVLKELPLVRGSEPLTAAGEGLLQYCAREWLLLKLLAERGGLAGLLLMAPIAALLVWLLARCLRQRQQLGRLTALAVVLSLGLETLCSVALNLGFVLFSAHLPLVTGNLHTVIDMTLIGLALSVFRGGSVLRDEPVGETRRSWFPWRIKISVISTEKT